MTTSTPVPSIDRPGQRTVTWSECGDPDGTPVLWCHGSPASRLDAAPDGPFATAFADAGVRMVACDRPGYGRSTPHPGRTLDDMADDAAAVLDALGIGDLAVVGYSAGGPVALTVARRLGERVTAVGVIAGIAPPALADHSDLSERDLWDAADDPDALRSALVPIAAGLREDPMGTAQQLLGPGLTESDLTVFADPRFADMFLSTLAESARADLVGWADDIDALRTDWTSTLGSVLQRVALVHGTADAMVPVRHGRVLAAALPNAALSEVDAGHLSVLTHLPGLVASLVAG